MKKTILLALAVALSAAAVLIFCGKDGNLSTPDIGDAGGERSQFAKGVCDCADVAAGVWCATVVDDASCGAMPAAGAQTLTSTSWKLAAVVDAANNTSRGPDYGERGNRDLKFTLTFGDDWTVSGKNEANSLFGQYSVVYGADTLYLRVATTKVCCDQGDGELFYSVIGRPRHFKLCPQELRIFYNEGKEYLKFARIDKITVPGSEKDAAATTDVQIVTDRPPVVIVERWPDRYFDDRDQDLSGHTPVAPEISMVFVKGGTFAMGCTEEQGDECFERDEMPVHKVTLGDFYIGKYEVTQKQWKSVMGYNPSRFKGDDHPVENVRYEEAHNFIAKLNSLTGKSYRLLTEAEWEYAARGGRFSRGFKYAGSNDADKAGWCGNPSGTNPVGLKAPNELGLYDMSGNVYEWVSGLRSDFGYCAEPQVNPAVSSCGVELPNPGRPIYDCQDPARPCYASYHERPFTQAPRPTIRGGCWQVSPESKLNCRVSRRYSPPLTFTNDDIGLRLALSPCPKSKHTEGESNDW